MIEPFEEVAEYQPWVKKSKEDLDLQVKWQEKLKETGKFIIGKNTYISNKAKMLCQNFKCGDNCIIAADSLVRADIEMGSHCSINTFAVLAGKIRMGDMVRIASHVSIFGFNHGHEDIEKPFCQQPCIQKGIDIGDDVWIGANVVIVDGVKVGSHSLLAAGAIVTKDVPPYSIVGGNPAKVIRDRRKPNKKSKHSNQHITEFGEKVRDQYKDVLNDAFDKEKQCYVDNLKNREITSRAWCDSVEIAAFFDETPEHFSKEFLIKQLQSYQNEKTGCFDKDLKDENPSAVQRLSKNSYDYLSIGYALECLGSHLKYKNQYLEKMSSEQLIEKLNGLAWDKNAWGSGAWCDNLGTAAYHDLKYHGGKVD